MINPKAVLGASAVVGAALSSLLFATPAGAAAPPPTVTVGVPTVIRTVADNGFVVGAATTAGSSAPIINFFVPGCFSRDVC